MTFRHYRPDFAPLPTLGSITGSSTLAPSLAAPPAWATIPLPPPPPPPSSTYKGTPHCFCGVPTLLRPDAKGRAKARLAPSTTTSSSAPSKQGGEKDREGSDDLLFFWACAAGMQNEGKTCRFWQRLEMQKEGRGAWFVPPSLGTAATGEAAGGGEGKMKTVGTVGVKIGAE